MPNPASPSPASPVRMELPEEIERAIESLIDEAKYEGGRWSSSDADVGQYRSALTAAILSSLSAAEAGREEWEQVAKVEASQRRHALARVERLEKALWQFETVGSDLRWFSQNVPPGTLAERAAIDRLVRDHKRMLAALSDPSLADLKETREGAEP